MRGTNKTKVQLLEELALLHQLNADLKNAASGHKRIEEAITGSEERYRNLVENAHDVLWVFDLNLGYTYVSASVKHLRGYSVEEAMHQRLDQVLTPESYKKAMEMFKRERDLEMNGQRHGSDWSLTTEFEMVRKDGSAVWAEVTMNTLYNEEGRIKGIMGITRDISERKQAEELMKESEKRFRSLIQKSLDIIIMLDSKGYIIYETPSLESILGYQQGDLLGKAPFEFIHPADLKRVENDLNEVYLKTNPGTPTEFRFRKADGTWVYLEAIGQNLLEDPAINGIVLTARDITERKRKEEALKESEQRFSAIFENAADGIILADIETNKFSMGNKQICEALGYSADELKSLTVTDIHPANDLPYVLDQFNKQVSKKITVAKDIPVKRKDGSIYFADVSSFPIPLMKRTYLLGIFRDITDRKQAEEEVKRHRDHLEDLVRERTVKLIQANERLKQEIEERKRAEDMLCMNEEIYRIHFSLSNDVMFTNDEEFRVLSVTPNVERVLGYKPKELVGRTFQEMEVLHPDDMGKAFADAQNVFSGGLSRHPIYRFITKDGKTKFGEVNGVPLIKKGRGATLISVARDITERIEKEKILLETLDRYRTHFSLTNDVMFSFDHKFKVKSVSPNVEKVLGYKPEDLIGKYVNEIGVISPECLDEAHDNALHLLSGQTIHSSIYEFITKDGKRKFAEVSSCPLKWDGRVVEVINVAREITHQIDHEKFLQESKETAQALLNACADFMVLSDITGTIINMNKEASENLGKGVKELLGTCLFDHLPKEVANRRKIYFEQVINSGKPIRFEDENQGRLIQSSLFPAHNELGKVTRIAMYARDITELKQPFLGKPYKLK